MNWDLTITYCPPAPPPRWPMVVSRHLHPLTFPCRWPQPHPGCDMHEIPSTIVHNESELKALLEGRR